MKRNLHILYAIALLQGMVFYSSVATLYRTAHGLTLGQITLIESISMLLTVALELPWGILADRIGYRRTMIACSFLFLLSKIIFWRADGFGSFLLERVVLSATVAGLSGVDESLLFLSAPKGESQRAFSFYSAFGTAGLLFSALVFSLFIGENYALAALLTVISHAAAALLSLGIVEVHSVQPQRRAAKDFLRLIRATLCDMRFLCLLVGYAVVSEGVQMATVWFNQPQYARCGMGVRTISAAYIAVTVCTLVAPLSKPLTDRLGARRFSTLVLLLCALSALTLACTTSALLSFVCIALMAAAGCLLSPLASELFNRQVSDADRATHLSIFSLVQSGVAAGADLLYGQAADVSLPCVFGVIAIAALLGCGAFALWFRRPESRPLT